MDLLGAFEHVPVSLEGMNARWLTGTLQAQYPGVEVLSLSTLEYDRGTTTRLRISARYNSIGIKACLPPQLFAKTSIDNVHRSRLISHGVIEPEIRFYAELAPRVSVGLSQVIVAAYDEQSGDGLLIMEDLSARGAKWGSALNPLSRSQAELVLKGMATLHATFWNSDELETLTWLPTPVSGKFAEWALSPERECGVGAVGRILEGPRGHIVEGHLRDAQTLVESFRRLQRLNAKSPHCLSHGDTHPGNFAWLPDGRPIFTDWQIVRRGSWAHDLSYFLAAALDTDSRRLWERGLLEGYLSQLEIRGVRVDFDDAWNAYRANLVNGLMYWLVTPGTMQSEAICQACIRRYAIAASDNAAIDVLQ